MSACVRSGNSVEMLETRRLFAAPISSFDQYIVDEDTSLVVPANQGLLANDFDPDADPFHRAAVQSADTWDVEPEPRRRG